MFVWQVTEMEKALEPKKEELQLSRKSTEKYDQKVEEWKVSRCSQTV